MARVNRKRAREVSVHNCKDCAHSLFCETWGEFKCTKREIRMYNPINVCEDYIEDPNKEEKSCCCEICEERGVEDDC